jgi:hypothetical protein
MLRWTATVAAFMAATLTGGTTLHPKRSARPERQQSMATGGYFVSRWKGAARAAGK